MSWKNTDPLDLWKTSTTLPIPVKNASIEESKFGTAKTRFWASLNEMGPKERALYFKAMLKVWPYPWEKRGVSWSINALPISVMASSLYISTKITADVFFVSPKLSFFNSFLKIYRRPPTLMIPVVAGIVSQYTCYTTILQPYFQHEGQLSTNALISRAFLIVSLVGVLSPLVSAPAAANCIFYHEQRKLGMRPFPQGSVVDLIAQTYECSRSIWRKLPIILAANLLLATAAVSALIWARDRIHSTIDLDPELIRTLMREKEEREEQEKGIFKGIKDNAASLKRKMDQSMILKANSGQPVSASSGDWRNIGTKNRLERFLGSPEIPVEELEMGIRQRTKSDTK